MKFFPNFIRRLRIEKDYTQDYLAMKLDMSVSAYSKLERGQTDPSLSRIIKIAEILEFDLAEFFLWKHQETGNNLLKEGNENSSYGYVTKREFLEFILRFEDLEHRMFRLEGK
jgi:transcriptional regulator with XRE-family HTH domain